MKKNIKIALHFLKLANKMSKTYIPLLYSTAIIKALSPFLNIIMPKFIIDELMGEKRIDQLILYVAITIIGNGLFNLLIKFLDTKVEIANFAMVNSFELHMGKHIMSMDYENLEDPEILDKKEKAIFPINNQGVLWRMFSSMINLLQSIITIVGLAAIVATLNFYLLLIIVAIMLINASLLKKEQNLFFEMYQGLVPLNRKIGYYITLISDFSFAKDIRIYHMAPYILKKVDAYNAKSLDQFGKYFPKYGKADGVSAINVQVQMLVVYAYMAWQVLKGLIGIGDFTMYIAAANNFSGSVYGILFNFVEFIQNCKYLEQYLEFEQLPSRSKMATKRVDKMEGIEIEFHNVSFKYPRSEEYTLRNVSLTIRSGEKLSIVGQNGAGKTTFIKLLCKLYEPQEGEILINGVDIREYSREEYNRLLAVVFQDFKLFSFSVRENISFYRNAEDRKLYHALEKAGLKDRIDKLEQGIETSIYKNFDKEGVELSGGENQKMAIARAIYKDSPIVILDEPTAALDPYAEFEIYTRFNDLVSNKTAIYISHRLSSCRFCDHIAVFDHGELVEYGTHKELEAKNGLYSKMWNTQAQYYA
jgi:ATP-binding cassette subfamily B protein/ATP-binding cassette subfamily C protein